MNRTSRRGFPKWLGAAAGIALAGPMVVPASALDTEGPDMVPPFQQVKAVPLFDGRSFE